MSPAVSVVLATRDRAPILSCTLDGILAQTGVSFEVVVADNGSSDGTSALLRRLSVERDLVYETVPEPGKNRALNAVLRHAHAPLVVFTDDDVLPQPHWLSELARAADRWPQADIFGGRTGLAWPPGTPDWLVESPEPALNFARFDHGDEERMIEWPPFGPNWAVRSSVLETHRFEPGVGPDGTGGYAMGSETEFMLRLMDRGHRVAYVPTAEVRHIVRPEQLRREALIARSHRHGRGWARVFEPSPDVPYLFGVPRWRWREVAGALAAHVGAEVRRAAYPIRLEAAMRFHRSRGSVVEYRRMARVKHRSGGGV